MRPEYRKCKIIAFSTLLCLQKCALDFKFTVAQIACILSCNITTCGNLLRTALLINMQTPYSSATCSVFTHHGETKT